MSLLPRTLLVAMLVSPGSAAPSLQTHDVDAGLHMLDSKVIDLAKSHGVKEQVPCAGYGG